MSAPETTLGMPTFSRYRPLAVLCALWTWCICLSVPIGILTAIVYGCAVS